MGGYRIGPKPLGERPVSAAEHSGRQRKEETLQHMAAALERLPYGRVATRREAGEVRYQAEAERWDWRLAEQELFETEPHRLVESRLSLRVVLDTCWVGGRVRGRLTGRHLE